MYTDCQSFAMFNVLKAFIASSQNDCNAAKSSCAGLSDTSCIRSIPSHLAFTALKPFIPPGGILYRVLDTIVFVFLGLGCASAVGFVAGVLNDCNRAKSSATGRLQIPFVYFAPAAEIFYPIKTVYPTRRDVVPRRCAPQKLIRVTIHTMPSRKICDLQQSAC